MIARNHIFARVFQFFPRKIIFLSRKKKKRKKGEEAKEYLVRIQTSSNQRYISSSILFLPLFLIYAHVYVL